MGWGAPSQSQWRLGAGGVLLSRGFLPVSCSVEEVVLDVVLGLRRSEWFINVCCWFRQSGLFGCVEKCSNCSPEERLFLGGDVNCTENPQLDRKDQEPHVPSGQIFELSDGDISGSPGLTAEIIGCPWPVFPTTLWCCARYHSGGT